MAYVSRIFDMPVASVYPHYVTKVEKKGRSREELHAVFRWLTGYTDDELSEALASRVSFREFFDGCDLNPHASLVTGSICGVKLADIDDPLMWRIRVLDKLVDEIARGRPLTKVLRETE
ncbi:DUF2200 domain-containing protein [Arcanobacterium haemolyticum]|nr:DUF2200 domain-containing protein [Arcanobacterium haemolyticum]